jgi:putative sugar O-methyltransferase
MNLRINEMIEDLSHAREEVLPSKFWIELNNKNVHQLETEGYENFKRTVVRNYFTWISGVRDSVIRSQLTYLFRNLSIVTLLPVTIRTLFTANHEDLNWMHTVSYNLLTRLIWAYALQIDNNQRVVSLSEPSEGNPLRVYYNKKPISQDLGNSFLEYQIIMDANIKTEAIKTVMELGAGYGRTGYVFLKLNPNIRYIIVDIPPALYIAEQYLSNQFADRKIFKFRHFDKYNEISQEFEQAQIAFLLPHQMELIPDKSVDLFLNISSLHEMLPTQVSYYLNQIDRLTEGYFYMKQWKKWFNNIDNVEITEKYPIPEHWSRLFWQQCRVQTFFFEALFAI